MSAAVRFITYALQKLKLNDQKGKKIIDGMDIYIYIYICVA
jgi:hypothetical protein